MIEFMIVAQIVAWLYLAISLFWFCVFISKKAFYFNRIGSTLGAIGAALLWPFGLLYLWLDK